MDFMSTTNETEKMKVLDAAKISLGEIKEEWTEIAEYYVKCMQSVIDNGGFEWAERESIRLLDLLKAGNIGSERKAILIDAKLDVASLFNVQSFMDKDRPVVGSPQFAELSNKDAEL